MYLNNARIMDHVKARHSIKSQNYIGLEFNSYLRKWD